MKIGLYGSFFFFLFCSSVFAELPEYCKTEYIRSVKSFIDANSPERFDYYYQKIDKNEDGPTFIIIPGGPGGTSISSFDPNFPFPFDFREIQWGLPNNSNVIYTDPRSKGCNQENKLSRKTYTTMNVANDIFNIIKQEGLSNYIIVGHSYGTVVSTILSQQIQNSILPQPFAIVLSGTLGNYFEQGNRYYGHEQSWRRLYHNLPQKLQVILAPTLLDDNEGLDLPFGIEADKWSSFIANGLLEGGSYIGGKEFFPLKTKLLSLVSGNDDELNELKNEILTVSTSNNYDDFFYEIYCNEIEEGSDDCVKAGLTDFARPFDSSFYSIKSKIIYFQGGQDPAVPLDRAIYHFENQFSLEKILITLPIGGHATGLIINDCKEWFWKELLNDRFEELENVVNKCPGDLAVRVGI